MKRSLILIFLLIVANSFGQESKYRFSICAGQHSLIFTGFKTFDNVVCPKDDDVYRIYNEEVYQMDYVNFSSSKNYSLGFTVNWFERSNWSLAQSFSFFKGTFVDRLRLTLLSHSQDTVYHSSTVYNSTNVISGNSSFISSNRELYGYSTSLVYYKKTNEKNFSFGGGIYWIFYGSDDYWLRAEDTRKGRGYRPVYLMRATGFYSTSQLGLSLNVKWQWKFLGCYANVGNSVLTMKKTENKGYSEWRSSIELFNFFPGSHNFDYRFPLSFETGIALSLDKIKK
ncbi:MAG: hypothetical protein IPH24_04455 [Crocinitomicaceae bacterium]|nr:hypothetical protein [Crocinitomicaceae bacterium]